MDIASLDVTKIKELNEAVWENVLGREEIGEKIQEWLDGIASTQVLSHECVESLLCVLGNFIYFPESLINELLRSLYRDIYQKMIIDEIRADYPDEFNKTAIETKIQEALNKTRFLGVGGPSESGASFLYSLRKMYVKDLSDKNHFTTIDALKSAIDCDVKYYVFIDDFCGSGQQVIDRLRSVIENLKSSNPNCRCYYFCFIGMHYGIENARQNVMFNDVKAVFELDSSFNVFDDTSKMAHKDRVDMRNILKDVCSNFVKHINANRKNAGCEEFIEACGFGESGQLIAFKHNTPDNTLPIFWYGDDLLCHSHLTPIFERHHKEG